MKANIYIINKLRDIHSKLKNISIKYQYDDRSLMHIVEIMPLSTYSLNDNYIDAEIDLTDSFEKLYPTESIMFVSEESLTRIITPEFALLPKLIISSKLNNYISVDDSIYEDIEIDKEIESNEDMTITCDLQPAAA